MTKVNDSLPPRYVREPNSMRVLLELTDIPDDTWQELFQSLTTRPGVASYRLDDGDEGHVFASVSLSPDVGDEDAKFSVQKLVDFVDEIDKEYSRREASFDHLEHVISEMFGPTAPTETA